MNLRGDSGLKLKLAEWTRYLGPTLRYATATKLLNLALAYLNYRRGTELISNMPAYLKVEISRHCQVDCKYCTAQKEELFFPFDRYKELVDQFGRHVFLISLYDVGEPLLNERVLEYIRYAHQRRIGTAISTSLSLNKADVFWQGLVSSGLDRLIVSIDGASQEVYQEYRTKGDLALVLSNLGAILRHRDARKSRMAVEWQMVDLPWNKHEQSLARDLARKMGCDQFRLIPDAHLPRRQNLAGPPTRKRNCLLAYVIFVVDAYNRVRSCYKYYEIPMFVGSMDENTFEEIWNGPGMISIRDKRQIRHRLGCRTCDE